MGDWKRTAARGGKCWKILWSEDELSRAGAIFGLYRSCRIRARKAVASPIIVKVDRSNGIIMASHITPHFPF
jgi:hypothetical protein